jgi:hypothetical protein
MSEDESIDVSKDKSKLLPHFIGMSLCDPILLISSWNG